MGVIEQAKEVVKLAQDMQDVELFRKIVDFQGEVFELHDANRTLRERVRELETELALRGRLVFERNFYWLRDGEKLDGPYCTRCYDRDHEARHMLSFQSGNIYGCPTCTLILHSDGSHVQGSGLSMFQRALMKLRPK